MDLKTLRELVAIDSPSGFTDKACQYIYDLLTEYGWKPEWTNKGSVVCALGENPVAGIAAHTDTLGAVVTKIKSDGSLRISQVGSPSLPAYEGSYCRVYTLEDQVYSGTLQLDDPAIHVNKNLRTANRTIENMHIRLDEEVFTEEEAKSLGIRPGDFICFEPQYLELPTGYIKSKFMDNKAGCFVLFELARRLGEQGKTAPVELYFTNYEEVGHGGAEGYSSTVNELLVIDMGVVGEDCAGRETACSICAKDASGPYDYNFRKKLVHLSEKNNIAFELDVYPFYRSDGSAALRAGQNLRVGLIGPGVAASHGVERTHVKGIQATIDLCMAYIQQL